MGDNINISNKYDGRLWTGVIWLGTGAASLNGAFFLVRLCSGVGRYKHSEGIGYLLFKVLSFFLAP
jgi:hypothetical protein